MRARSAAACSGLVNLGLAGSHELGNRIGIDGLHRMNVEPGLRCRLLRRDGQLTARFLVRSADARLCAAHSQSVRTESRIAKLKDPSCSQTPERCSIWSAPALAASSDVFPRSRAMMYAAYQPDQ